MLLLDVLLSIRTFCEWGLFVPTFLAKEKAVPRDGLQGGIFL